MEDKRTVRKKEEREHIKSEISYLKAKLKALKSLTPTPFGRIKKLEDDLAWCIRELRKIDNE